MPASRLLSFAVYTAFYLQQAAVLLRPNGTRSLHVGLGIGTAAKAMQRLGVAAGGRRYPGGGAAACRSRGSMPAPCCLEGPAAIPLLVIARWCDGLTPI